MQDQTPSHLSFLLEFTLIHGLNHSLHGSGHASPKNGPTSRHPSCGAVWAQSGSQEASDGSGKGDKEKRSDALSAESLVHSSVFSQPTPPTELCNSSFRNSCLM